MWLGAPALIVAAWIDPIVGTTTVQRPATSATARIAGDQVQVARIVEHRNRAAVDERAALEADGWTRVEMAPPDRQLLGYDTSLLATREAELRQQLATTIPSAADIANVADLARRGDAATRAAAIDALGRSRDPAGQHALVDLLVSQQFADGSPERRQLVAQLRPTDLDDPFAAELARLIDAPQLTSSEQQAVAFTLVLVAMRDGTSLPDDVRASLSPAARARMDRSVALVRRQGDTL